MLPIIDSTDYENHFWNALRGKKGHKEHLEKGVESNTGAYTMTTKGQNKFTTAIKNESIFRNIATAVQVFDHDYRIKTVGINDVAAWVAEGGTIPLSDGMEDFGEITLGTHKLAVFLKLEETLIRDSFFKVEDYLVKRLAKNFADTDTEIDRRIIISFFDRAYRLPGDPDGFCQIVLRQIQAGTGRF
jgi:HK97 family phage major capsid protein